LKAVSIAPNTCTRKPKVTKTLYSLGLNSYLASPAPLIQEMTLYIAPNTTDLEDLKSKQRVLVAKTAQKSGFWRS
jgi:hypothetical protein